MATLNRTSITQDRVKELFDYRDGELLRRVAVHGSKVKVGDPVGTPTRGYKVVCVDYKLYRVHRLVWVWHHGDLPEHIDHIDGDPGNNRIENLRPCSHQQNHWNTRLKATNKSGVKGVSWNRDVNKWQAHIRIKGKSTYLGLFESIDEAANRLRQVRSAEHGEYARHG